MFARTHGIASVHYVREVKSEHTVERKFIDDELRPAVKEEPQLFADRVGLRVDHTHHGYPAPPGEGKLEYGPAAEKPEHKARKQVGIMEELYDHREDLTFMLMDYKVNRDETRTILTENRQALLDIVLGQKAEAEQLNLLIEMEKKRRGRL